MMSTMSKTIFTQIRLGELPGEIIYQDKVCFVILSIRPHNPGHMLVIPVREVANWEDLDPETLSYLMKVAQFFAKVTKAVYQPPKVGLASVGFEVPHTHIHVYSLMKISDIDHTTAKNSSPAQLKSEADKIARHIASIGGVKV